MHPTQLVKNLESRRSTPTLNGNLTGQPFEVGHIEKQRNLASILKLQRAAKRLWDWRIS